MCPMSATSPSDGPAQATAGDAEIVLDDGTALPVHSALLALGSSVLHTAVQLASEGDNTKIRVKMQSTSLEEAQALLLLLYSNTRESHALGLPLGQLRLLASVCDRFSFEGLLLLVDQALAKHSGDCCPDILQGQAQAEQYLKPENATELFWEARSKNLIQFQAACAKFIGFHVVEVSEAAHTDALGPVLIHAAAVLKESQMRSLKGSQANIEKALADSGVSSTAKPSSYSSGTMENVLLAILAKLRAHK